MSPLTIEQAFALALQHHQSGRLQEAEHLYRQILDQQPEHPGALHLLGVIAYQAGRCDIGVDLIRQAIALKPAYPEAYSNLGFALKDAGRLEEAIAAYRQAIALKPDFVEAHSNLGFALWKTGRLNEAIAAYRQAIDLKPESPETHSNLGVALANAGRLDEAIVACRQAIALKPDYPEAYSNLGCALKDIGCLDEAIAACRQAIAMKPQYPEAYSNLGSALKDAGRLDEAITAQRQAIALKPQYPEAQSNLGVALANAGRLNEAIAAHRRAIVLKPDFAEFHNNLGFALWKAGRLDEAIATYRQAIDLKPDLAEAHNSLGIALAKAGRLEEAIAAYRRAIALKPQYAEAYSNLGCALKDTGRLDEAIAACRQAVALNPEYPEAHCNLGAALGKKGGLDEAIAAYRQAIALKLEYPEAHCNLGAALGQKGDFDEAIVTCRQAIALKPQYPEAYSNLGCVLKDAGRLDEAIAAYRQAVALNPNNSGIHSNLVYAIQLHPAYDAQVIAEEHRVWNQQHAKPLAGHIRPHDNDRDPDRRLRIGYVAPDFREHPVGRFLLPLLANHDKSQVHVFAYADVLEHDALTRTLGSHVDDWRSIVGLSDDQVARLIRNDGIDILVDLTMHTACNRLLVFARKPAPVQVTYLAYCSTTGLETIDYRLSDPWFDPPGMDESIYSEKTLRLPETYWCYQPSVTCPEVRQVPALTKGYITFGCLNNFCKVSKPALMAWARILRAMPDSRLLLHAGEGALRLRVREELGCEGIELQRVQFSPRVPLSTYFDLYHSIDLALDPFPYGGGTTTCDALYMGVPVVTLAGRTAVGRAGLSQLMNLNLGDFIAQTPEEYISLAIALAGDRSRLAELRRTLRQRMEQSPLMDAPRFACNIEAAYRNMWRRWCGIQSV